MNRITLIVALALIAGACSKKDNTVPSQSGRLGHVWSTKPGNVVKGCWCPLCANLERSKKRGKRLKYDFEG